jgi:hypothetical protein
MASICCWIHASTVGLELLELGDEFRLVARLAGALTPTFDGRLECVRDARAVSDCREVA